MLPTLLEIDFLDIFRRTKNWKKTLKFPATDL